MNKLTLFSCTLCLLALCGCMVGPNYRKPPAVTAPAFKEAGYPEQDGWKNAQPSDAKLKGNWWVMFEDERLNELEPQVDAANQTLKAAQADFQEARAQIGFVRSNQAPTISIGSTTTAVRDSANQPYFLSGLANNGTGNLILPIDLNYEVDLWGRIRRSVTAAKAQAQASDADLENARLSLHAELAIDYFGLRATDAQIQLLRDTTKAYESALELTQARFTEGAVPQSDVAQAKTELDQARVQLTDLEAQRAQYEHAIAVLIGKPPAELSLAPLPMNQKPPALPNIPTAMPAVLLERRPDIAADERRMAAANEQIGIAQAAYYPTLSIGATGGLQGTSALNWFAWPSRFWAVGAGLSETLFDGGRRKASKRITVAQYDATIANYRQTVLTAFQQVEDNLAATRLLQKEAAQQHEATDSAEQSLDLSQARYEGGVDTYLQVITWQTAALSNQRNDLTIQQRRLNTSVRLVKALGGGWDTGQLPKF
jgi:NodT family efflux transporter outer membrane factor (OMF) lipoprotein